MAKPKPNTTTTTELNLLTTVIANPTDAVALEVYADYLQEQGAERAQRSRHGGHSFGERAAEESRGRSAPEKGPRAI